MVLKNNYTNDGVGDKYIHNNANIGKYNDSKEFEEIEEGSEILHNTETDYEYDEFDYFWDSTVG